MTNQAVPRIIGIDQLSDETALVREDKMFVREAVNVDIDAENNISRRKGATVQLPGMGYHSLYSSSRGLLMLCYKNLLGVYTPETATFAPLILMDDAYTTSFTEVNQTLYAMNPSFSCMFLPGSGTPKPLGVPLPTVEVEFSVISSGAMEEGSYGIAYSVVDPDGEESGLSRVIKLTLEAGQGVLANMLMIMPGYKYRIYMTTANGEELRQALELDADTISVQILAPEEGRQAETFGLEPPPYGYMIRSFGARLLIASFDGHIYYTEAFRPHLYAPENSIAVEGYASLVESVNDGVFIGDRYGVRFYKGDDPSDWVVENASPERAIFNTGTTVSGSFFGGELEQYDSVAVWLTQSGYQVGLPSGKVMRLNADQLKTPAYVQGCSVVSIFDGRKQVITAVNSNELADASVALDSTTI